MNTYELVVMLSPELKADAIKGQSTDLESKVKDLGGKIKLITDWGLKNLAYKVGKFEQAYYHIYSLEMDPLKVNLVITYLNHKDGVVRNLLSVIDRED